MNHIYALLKLAALNKQKDVFVHVFTDGRDTSPTSGIGFLTDLHGFFKELGVGQISTVMGRYWAMDRDRRWERTQLAYDAMVHGKGEKVSGGLENIIPAVQARYESGETDEFLKPIVVDHGAGSESRIKAGDLVIGFNFRADRMRQICYFLCGVSLKDAPAPDALGVDLLTMTNYDSDLTQVTVIYPPRKMSNILGEVLSANGLKQLRIAETEKYPHVTFFFNGGREAPFDGEDRELIPSPKVATYDLQPEMSISEVTRRLVEHIQSRKYDVVILNYANCDMVGHTGSLDAATKAVEAVDDSLGKALEALDAVGGDALITADHGNAEQMFDPATNGPHTAHTTNLVPLIFYGPNKGRFSNPRRGGVLADIAPTILDLLGIERPEEMTGQTFAT